MCQKLFATSKQHTSNNNLAYIAIIDDNYELSCYFILIVMEAHMLMVPLT